MIFTRIRVEGCQNLSHERKSMCHHHVLIFPSFLVLFQPPPLKSLLLVGVVMAGIGVWQDCHSFPTRTLHQQTEPHDGKKNDYAPHSTLSTTMPFFPLSVHPHVGTVVYSFSRIGIFYVWSHAARRGKQFGCHSRSYRVVSSVFSIRIPEVWCKFPSHRGWESVFSSPVRLV